MVLNPKMTRGGGGRVRTVRHDRVSLRQDATYRFIMRFNDPRPSGPKDLGVEINGSTARFALHQEADHYICEVILDRAMLAKCSGLCRIQIDTGETISPGSADIRLLGILVRQIEFICQAS